MKQAICKRELAFSGDRDYGGRVQRALRAWDRRKEKERAMYNEQRRKRYNVSLENCMEAGVREEK